MYKPLSEELYLSLIHCVEISDETIDALDTYCYNNKLETEQVIYTILADGLRARGLAL